MTIKLNKSSTCILRYHTACSFCPGLPYSPETQVFSNNRNIFKIMSPTFNLILPRLSEPQVTPV